MLRLNGPADSTVIVSDALLVENEASTVTTVVVVTGVVPIAKVAERAVSGTDTDAGTETTDGELLTKLTVTPPVGAG